MAECLSVEGCSSQEQRIDNPLPSANDSRGLVILSSSLADSELHRLLTMQPLKIKVSKATLPHTCLYPQSSVAFMILPTAGILTSWPPTNQSKLHPKLAEHLEKFSTLHHKRYVLVTSPLIGLHEQAAISFLQEKYLMADMHFLPMHNSKECAEGMQNIAKLCSRQFSALVRQRMESLETQLVSEESIMSILKELGLPGERECVMVMDGCVGLAGLASVSKGELMDLNLEQGTIRGILDILHN